MIQIWPISLFHFLMATVTGSRMGLRTKWTSETFLGFWKSVGKEKLLLLECRI